MNKITLTPAQAQLLRFVYDRQQAIFSGILSTLVTEHGHKITDNSTFSLNPDMTELEVTEKVQDKDTKDVVEAK